MGSAEILARYRPPETIRPEPATCASWSCAPYRLARYWVGLTDRLGRRHTVALCGSCASAYPPGPGVDFRHPIDDPRPLPEPDPQGSLW